MNRDEILLCTGLPPLKAAESLARALEATLRVDDEPVVFRQVSGEWKDEATAGGKVSENYLRDTTAAPSEQSVYDVGYDTIYEVWVSRTVPTDVDQLQRDEARRIFAEVTGKLPFPAVHTSDGGLIFSAWDPKLGRADFPPGTGDDEDDREQWEPYAYPRIP